MSEPLPSAPPEVDVPTVDDASAQSVDGTDLGRHAARGAGITLAAQLTRMALQFVSIVVLARLLHPSDYGLLAIVLVIVGVGEIFRDFGLTTAAVQADTLSRQQRDNLFWLNASIGVALSLLMFSSAGMIANVFGHPAVLHIAQIMALTFTLNGLATQYRADLSRRLAFGRLALADIVGQLAALCIAIPLAATGAGYWALVVQQLCQLGTALVLLVLMGQWLPRRPRDLATVRPLVRMGLNLAGTEVIYYLGNNVDTFIVGLRFSAADLGAYNRGYQLLTTPLNQLRTPATTVALPILSRMQHDHERAAGYLRRSQLALGYTLVPALAVAAGAATPTVALLLGPQWTRVVPLLALFAVAGACQTLAYVAFWVYLSRGLANQLFRYTVATIVLQALCIGIGSSWGVIGVASGLAVATVLEWPASLVWLSRLTPLPRRDLLLGAGRIVGCAVPIGLVAFVVSRALAAQPPVFVLLAALTAGGACLALFAAIARPVRADIVGVLGFARRMVGRAA